MTESHSKEFSPEQRRHFWKEHIERWKQDTTSQLSYCRQFNLKPHQFTYWKKRFGQNDTSINFVPLQLSTPNVKMPQTRFSVLTPNGYKIEVAAGFDPSALKQLINVVQSL